MNAKRKALLLLLLLLMLNGILVWKSPFRVDKSKHSPSSFYTINIRLNPYHKSARKYLEYETPSNAIIPSKNSVFIICQDTTPVIYDYVQEKEVWRGSKLGDSHADDPTVIHVSDDRYVYMINPSNSISIFDLDTRTIRKDIYQLDYYLSYYTIDDSDKNLIGSCDLDCNIFNLKTGKLATAKAPSEIDGNEIYGPFIYFTDMDSKSTFAAFGAYSYVDYILVYRIADIVDGKAEPVIIEGQDCRFGKDGTLYVTNGSKLVSYTPEYGKTGTELFDSQADFLSIIYDEKTDSLLLADEDNNLFIYSVQEKKVVAKTGFRKSRCGNDLYGSIIKYNRELGVAFAVVDRYFIYMWKIKENRKYYLGSAGFYIANIYYDSKANKLVVSLAPDLGYWGEVLIIDLNKYNYWDEYVKHMTYSE